MKKHIYRSMIICLGLLAFWYVCPGAQQPADQNHGNGDADYGARESSDNDQSKDIYYLKLGNGDYLLIFDDFKGIIFTTDNRNVLEEYINKEWLDDKDEFLRFLGNERITKQNLWVDRDKWHNYDDLRITNYEIRRLAVIISNSNHEDLTERKGGFSLIELKLEKDYNPVSFRRLKRENIQNPEEYGEWLKLYNGEKDIAIINEKLGSKYKVTQEKNSHEIPMKIRNLADNFKIVQEISGDNIIANPKLSDQKATWEIQRVGKGRKIKSGETKITFYFQHKKFPELESKSSVIAIENKVPGSRVLSWFRDHLKMIVLILVIIMGGGIILYFYRNDLERKLKSKGKSIKTSQIITKETKGELPADEETAKEPIPKAGQDIDQPVKMIDPICSKVSEINRLLKKNLEYSKPSNLRDCENILGEAIVGIYAILGDIGLLARAAHSDSSYDAEIKDLGDARKTLDRLTGCVDPQIAGIRKALVSHGCQEAESLEVPVSRVLENCLREYKRRLDALNNVAERRKELLRSLNESYGIVFKEFFEHSGEFEFFYENIIEWLEEDIKTESISNESAKLNKIIRLLEINIPLEVKVYREVLKSTRMIFPGLKRKIDELGVPRISQIYMDLSELIKGDNFETYFPEDLLQIIPIESETGMDQIKKCRNYLTNQALSGKVGEGIQSAMRLRLMLRLYSLEVEDKKQSGLLLDSEYLVNALLNCLETIAVLSGIIYHDLFPGQIYDGSSMQSESDRANLDFEERARLAQYVNDGIIDFAYVGYSSLTEAGLEHSRNTSRVVRASIVREDSNV